MSNLIYNDENLPLIDVSIIGGKGKGFIFLFMAFSILFTGFVMMFFSIRYIIESEEPILSIFLFLMIFMFFILIGIILFIGGLYGVSSRNLKIYDDHIELSFFWKKINRKDIIDVISDPLKFKEQEQKIEKYYKNRSIFNRPLKMIDFKNDLEWRLSKRKIIMIHYKNRNRKGSFEILSKDHHHDLEAIEKMILASRDGFVDIKKTERDGIRIIPELDLELRNRFKKVYLPLITTISFLMIGIIIVFFLINETILALFIVIFFLFYFFFNIITSLFLMISNKKCIYQIKDEKIIIHNAASKLCYEIEFKYIRNVKRLNNKTYRNVLRFVGLSGKYRLVAVPYMMKNLIRIDLKKPIKPESDINDLPHVITIIVGDNEENEAYYLLKKHLKNC